MKWGQVLYLVMTDLLVGNLFQGRYKAVLIQKDSHLLEVCRYVVLNPLRAKAVARVEPWKWSSYKGTAGLGEGPPWLAVDWVLSQFAKKDIRPQTLPTIRDGGH